MLLNAENIKVVYDSATIINDITIKVDENQIVGLVGPNGAGKTTFLRAVTGLVNWEKANKKGQRQGKVGFEGKVEFMGEDITNLMPHEIAQRGLIHCPERRRLFSEMTVFENLQAGAYLTNRKSKGFNQTLELIYSLFPILKARSKQVSGTLSGGEQQMLAVGRAIMQKPKLLCIDEPSIGLAPLMKKTVFEQIKVVADSGIPILLVEQDVMTTFSMSQVNYVLSHGRLVCEGSGEQIMQDEIIRKSYLGI